jgi:serine protease Do/serine protease DegQ
MNSLIETGKVTRGYLGLTTEYVSPENAETFGLPKGVKGLAVTVVEPGGPADKAGVKLADVIVGVNNRPVSSVEDLRLYVAELRPGSKVTLKLIRDRAEKTLEAVVGAMEDKPNELLPGVQAAALTDETRQALSLNPKITGVVITQIERDSDYLDRLAPGVVIVEVNRTPVSDVASARAALRSGRNLFLVYFRGVFRYVTITKR